MSSSALISVAMVAIAAFLSSIFRSDKLPRSWNIALALAAFAIIVAGDVWLTTGFASDPRILVTSLIVAGVALGGRELWALLGYVEGVASPLEALVRPTIIQRRSTPPFVVPTQRPPDQVL